MDSSISSLAVKCCFIYSRGHEVEQGSFSSVCVCFLPCAGQDGAASSRPASPAAPPDPGVHVPRGTPSPASQGMGILALLAVPGEWQRAFPLPKVQGRWAHFSSYYPHLQRLPLLSLSATANSNSVRCCHQSANTSCHSSPPARPMAAGRWLLTPSHPCSQTSSSFSHRQPGLGPAHAKGQFQ